jgi:predicted outer membrane repeat protein
MKNTIQSVVFALLGCSLFPFNVGAQTTYIGSWNPVLYPGTTCSWSSQDASIVANGSLSTPYASWWAAAQYVSSNPSAGQTIEFLPDAYIQNYDYDNQNGAENCSGNSLSYTLAVTSALNGLTITGTTGGCGTFLDVSSISGNIGPIIQISGANNITIRNFYFKGFNSVISIANSTNITIENCVFDACAKSGLDAISITSTGLAGNAAAGGAGTSNTTTVNLLNCKFLNHNNDPSVSAMTILANSGTSAHNTDVNITDCEFICNTRNNTGGALNIAQGSSRTASHNGPTVDISNCVFSNNTATTGKGGALAIGIQCFVSILNSDFYNNSASPSSATADQGGGAVYINQRSNVSINGCTFKGNSVNASAVYGGAIYTSGNSTVANYPVVSVVNSFFDSNSAFRGGAIAFYYSNFTMTGNYFTNNNANSRGGGFWVRSGGTNSGFTTNTFSNNRLNNVLNTGSSDAYGDVAVAGTNNIFAFTTSVTNSGGTAGCSCTYTAPNVSAYTCAGYCSTSLPPICLANILVPSVCDQPGSNAGVSGQIWQDVNGNGIKEVGDNGLSNVYVNLYNSSNYLMGRALTNASGQYTFTGVPPGNYYVVVAMPQGQTVVSPPNASGNEATDSDITNPASQSTASFSLVSGQTLLDVGAGFSTVVLPVELLYFKAEALVCGKTQLTWATATEDQNHYFSIERSIDGVHFESIAELAGAGTSMEELSYSHIDNNASGKLYYRLAQFDFNGAYSRSDVQFVEHSCTLEQVSISPVPFDKILNISIFSTASQSVSMVLSNTLGQQVLHREQWLDHGDNAIQLYTDAVLPGVYLIQVYQDGRLLYSNKLVK